ncbi:phage major tail tube protein, partial [Yersinia enterocolitica]
TIDGKVVMEIDVVNLIEIVNGVDLLEAQRKAIGR